MTVDFFLTDTELIWCGKSKMGETVLTVDPQKVKTLQKLLLEGYGLTKDPLRTKKVTRRMDIPLYDTLFGLCYCWRFDFCQFVELVSVLPLRRQRYYWKCRRYAFEVKKRELAFLSCR